MALLTEGKVNQFGVQEEYWRILNVNINLQYNYCDITIGAYANAEARINGSEPMNIKKIRAKWDNEEFFKYFSPDTFINSSEINFLNETEQSNMSHNIYERFYDYIKVKDKYFESATDC